MIERFEPSETGIDTARKCVIEPLQLLLKDDGYGIVIEEISSCWIRVWEHVDPWIVIGKPILPLSGVHRHEFIIGNGFPPACFILPGFHLSNCQAGIKKA